MKLGRRRNRERHRKKTMETILEESWNEKRTLNELRTNLEQTKRYEESIRNWDLEKGTGLMGRNLKIL